MASTTSIACRSALTVQAQFAIMSWAAVLLLVILFSLHRYIHRVCLSVGLSACMFLCLYAAMYVLYVLSLYCMHSVCYVLSRVCIVCMHACMHPTCKHVCMSVCMCIHTRRCQTTCLCTPTNKNILAPPSTCRDASESFHEKAAARCKCVRESLMCCQVLQVTIKSCVQFLALARGNHNSSWDGMPCFLVLNLEEAALP